MECINTMDKMFKNRKQKLKKLWDEREWYTCRVMYCLDKYISLGNDANNFLSWKWFRLYEIYSDRRDKVFAEYMELMREIIN